MDGTLARKYETENEGKAREKYFRIMSEQHEILK